jgi:hypothetical protein
VEGENYQKKGDMLSRIRKIFKQSSGKEVADKLESLGYFKYADPGEVEYLKNEISNAYEAYGMLSTTYTIENGTHYPDDYRLYSLDNESLFAKGAFERFFKEIDPTLQKLNVPIRVEEEEESFSEARGLNHSITVNGSRYVIFKNFRYYSRGSAVATKRCIEIINDVLSHYDTDERVYPVGRGHYGQMIFLTAQQFNYVSTVYPDTQRKPLKMKQWSRRSNPR